VQAFVQAYTRKYGTLPDGNAALAYDATKLLAAAVQKVGADRRRIRDFLAGLSTADAYRGVTGKLRFRPDGDPVDKGMVMTRVHRGALQMESAP
jgi:branched-chain amino acid transport system substrate-binding protein